MDVSTPNPNRPGPPSRLALLHSLLPKRGFEYKRGSRILQYPPDAEDLLDALAQSSSYLGPRQVDRRLAELFKTAREWSPPSSSSGETSLAQPILGYYTINPAFTYAATHTFWTASSSSSPSSSGLRADVVAEAMGYLCAARALYIKFTTYRTPWFPDGGSGEGEGRLARAIDAFTGQRPAEAPLPCFRRMDPRLVDMIIWRVRRGLRADWDEWSDYNDDSSADEASENKKKKQKKENKQEKKEKKQDGSLEDKPLEQGKENHEPEKEADNA
ncbi:hypothetical protein F4809DRAFT_664299 [Biscogniauxia mediterranea]|nr:hypothetical protein F4809DRAFT_664299 [Biscogniauxia mediterranea]